MLEAAHNTTDGPGSSVVITIEVHTATQLVIDHVWEFLSNDGPSGPVETINDLLLSWLKTPFGKEASSTGNNLIIDTHILVNFIVRLSEYMNMLEIVKLRQQLTTETISNSSPDKTCKN